MEKRKNIVDNLNKLLNTDYNISSFDSIHGNDLLNVAIKVFRKFELFGKEENSSPPPLLIMNVLNNIKYVPDEELSPEEFRSGLVAGFKNVIYPILTFVLENEEIIKKRFYLSKYVTPVDVPLEYFANDSKMQTLYQVYQHNIDNFWNLYSENKKEAMLAREVNELENDIYQMKLELSNLKKRIESQHSKANLSEGFLKAAGELVQERKKLEKITKQIETDNMHLGNAIESLKNYNRRDKIRSLEDILDKSEHYAHAQQVYSLSVKEIESDLKMIEEVATEPSDEDLSNLEVKQQALKDIVVNLSQNKQLDDVLSAMQNQQRILQKQKSQLSKQIIRLRLNNEQVQKKVEELFQILGGNVLHGKAFKNYIFDLKAMSNIYKQNKAHLKSLENEEIVLIQTLKELCELDPNLKDTNKDLEMIPEELQNLSLDEVRMKTFKLQKEHNSLLRICCEEEEKFQKVKDAYGNYLIEFDQTKHKFNMETDNLLERIKEYKWKIDEIESLHVIEKDELHLQLTESENLQECLFRYSQMFIENAGDVSSADILKHKLSFAQKQHNELLVQVNQKQHALKIEENEKLKLKGVIYLLSEDKV